MSDETLKKAYETMRSKRDIERRDHSEAIEDLRHPCKVCLRDHNHTKEKKCRFRFPKQVNEFPKEFQES